jgi:hypothetical protein
MNTSQTLEMEASYTTSDLLDNIWRKIGSDKQANSLIAGITRMTRRALNASASSLFLVDEETQDLLLKFAVGPVKAKTTRFKIDSRSGARGGQPIVSNDVINNPRFNRLANTVYGFPAQSIICAPLIIHRKIIGVIEVANKAGQPDFSEQDLHTLIGVSATAALVIENVRLNDCLQDYYKSTVNALVSLADAKETAGCGHSKRVAEYALMGAKSLELTKKQRLHDIGKLAIPDSILNKPDNLTDEEREIMNKHTETGYNLVRRIPLLEEASRLILYHHERYDGLGYPRQMKGEAIPIGARLIAVADAFDNMTTEHAYRKALDVKQAFIELNRHAHTQFCPVAVKAFYSGFLKVMLPDAK